MLDVRCAKCDKLLGKVNGEYQIKCTRCGEMNSGTAEIDDKTLTLYYAFHNGFDKIDRFREDPDFFKDDAKRDAEAYCVRNKIEYKSMEVLGEFNPSEYTQRGKIIVTLK